MLTLFAAANFVERLLPFEREIFLWLNNQRSDFLDTFMYIYSDKCTWLPLFVIFIALLFYKTKWKEVLLIAICAVLLGLLCDFVAAEFIKPFFGRLRPTHHPDFKDFVDIVQGKRGGRFGFISNHAANGFGIAMFTSLLFRYRVYTVTIFTWVLITVYSRIYLGVHFITDVIGGMIWGMLVGLFVYEFYLLCRKYILHIPREQLKEPPLSRQKVCILIVAIGLTVLYIVVRGLFFQIPH